MSQSISLNQIIDNLKNKELNQPITNKVTGYSQTPSKNVQAIPEQKIRVSNITGYDQVKSVSSKVIGSKEASSPQQIMKDIVILQNELNQVKEQNFLLYKKNEELLLGCKIKLDNKIQKNEYDTLLQNYNKLISEKVNITKLQTELDEATSTISNLKKEIEQNKINSGNIQIVIDKIRDNITQLINKNLILDIENKRLNNELSTEKTNFKDMKASLEQTINDLNLKNTDLANANLKEISKFNIEKVNLQKQIQIVKDEITALKATCNKNDNTIARANIQYIDELAQLKNSQISMEKELNTVKSEIERLTKVNEIFTACQKSINKYNNMELTSENIDTVISKIQKFDKMITQLHDELFIEKTNFITMKTKLEQDIINLNLKNTKLVNNYEEKITNYNIEKINLQEQIKIVNDRLSVLNIPDNKQYIDEIAILNTNKTALKAELTSVKLEIIRLTKVEENFTACQKSLNKYNRMELTPENIDIVIAKIQDLDNMIKQLSTEKTNFTDIKKKLEQDINDLN